MKRNVKDTYNNPNDPVADPDCQIWLGGGGGAVIQTLRLGGGRAVLKKIFSPSGFSFV